MKIDPLLNGLNSDTYLGFDFGIRKIGVAVGHVETGIANPLTTIRAVKQKPGWQAITDLVNRWQPRGCVVGLSLQQDGTENPVSQPMLRFCRQLEGRYQVPVFRMDETLTTVEAKRLLFEELELSASKLWQVQDQLAAQLILQSWLNHYHARK